MRFQIRAHQGKERPFREALLAAGHEEHRDHELLLIDFGIPHPSYEEWTDEAKRRGIPICVYPHGFAAGEAQHLSQEPVEAAVTFVYGPGQVFLSKAYGHPNPVCSVGYPMPRRPLEPREVRHVLFAPHHPLGGTGWMPEDAREANTKAFRTLLGGDFDLIVRLIGSPEQNGLWLEPGVTYIDALMDGSVTKADVAVCGGTYLANSLCAGIPCVAYNQSREWRVEEEGQEEFEMLPNWLRHEPRTRYPFDLGTFPECINAAAKRSSYPQLQKWIEDWMPPWRPDRFVERVENVYLEHVGNLADGEEYLPRTDQGDGERSNAPIASSPDR